MKIVITVPHSLCVIGGDHLCDYAAPKAGRMLSDKMNAKLFLADINRREIDYNRIESRGSNWRKQITEYIHKNNVELLLDVHSYPNESRSFGLVNGEIPEVVILDSYDDVSHKIFKDLSSKGILVLLLKGEKNDITDEMKQIGVKTALIEFNEDLKYNRLNLICDIIASSFH